MKILLRNHNKTAWKLVKSSEYSSEADLHRLLAESPEIIPMDEIRPGSGPLVAAVCEFTLPVGSIDLVAFNAEGDIAIIECKLAHNTQAKREVIGQVLDYAAHLWGMSYEDFDQKVKERQDANLADWIQELVATPEWETEMLVPRVFGPVRAMTPKPPAKRKWDEDSYFADLRTHFNEIEVGVAEKILIWAKENVTRVWWGEGLQAGVRSNSDLLAADRYHHLTERN